MCSLPTPTPTPSEPSLTIAKTASAGTLTRGGTGTFTLTVTNSGDGATNGTTVTVTDTLPTGLTPTAASGTGWTCSVSSQTVTCTRTDALSTSASYAAITVAATVASDAGASLTNTASVSGGGDSTAATGSVTVATSAPALPSLTVAKTASAATLTRGSTGSFTLTVTNSGNTATNGQMVYVTDELPTGLTPTTASGTGWACTVMGQAVGCTRIDALSASASYAAIAVAVTVASDAGASLTNTASVVGGGDGSYASASVTVSTAATCANGGACILGNIGPGGGLVFLISGGLRYEMAPKTWVNIAAGRHTADETISLQWCNDQLSDVTGAVGTEVGTGSANTTAVDAACTSGAGQSAADYSANGLSDWFLPSQDELNAMCNYSRTWTGAPSTLACTGAQNGAFAAGTYGFASDDYWSSSQLSSLALAVWYRALSDGSDLVGTKGNSFRVRPVRAF